MLPFLKGIQLSFFVKKLKYFSSLVYQDISYFSYIFKKSVSLTSNKYRNDNIKNFQIS